MADTFEDTKMSRHSNESRHNNNNHPPPRKADSIEQLRGLSRISGQSQLSTNRNKTQRGNQGNQDNAADGADINKQRKPNTRQSYRSDTQERGTNQDTAMTNRSPGPISRTPSADRQLLRNLTVTPDTDDLAPTKLSDADFRHPSPNKPGPSNKSRHALNAPTQKSPSYADSPANQSIRSEPAANKDLKILNLPGSPTSIKGDDWQTGKTVSEANNYMLKYEVVADVTFSVGDEREDIRAHKYMLMSRSSVLFKSLIKHLGNPDVKIQVPDIKPAVFRDMLQYMYTDEFDIHTDNVAPMLHAAKKFQLKGLIDTCFKYLDGEIHDETVPKILELAHIYNESALYEKCFRYILNNAQEVLRKFTVCELCSDCLSKLLKSDELAAGEDAVLEGSMTWADAECRRRKLHVNDENRRQVLGKLLYLIRFPIMEVTYFTQKVSMGNLLSHDETLSIFQYFHGEEQQLPNRFSRNERKWVPQKPRDNSQHIHDNNDHVIVSSNESPNMSRVRRFPITDGQWKQNGPPDAISFTVNYPILLYGVELFGCGRGQETYEVKIMVYDDINRQEIRKNDASIFTNMSKTFYSVKLSRPVRIPPRRVYTVVILMKGNPVFKGIDGEAVQEADGVTFEFCASNRSSNGTDVTVGQIPGILFSKTT